jgi:DNA-binding FadR family transcriptional regulator
LEAIEEKKAQVAEDEMIEHIKFSEKNMFEAEGTIENGTK